MRFGPVPVQSAEGAILAHSVQANRTRIRKGTVLAAEHLAALEGAGVGEVVAARLEPGDVGEDEAAARLAQALPRPDANLALTEAKTGRVNLYARSAGVVVYDPARIRALNAVDPMLTLAVLPPYAAVGPRSLVGTVKIISYGVADAAVIRAAEIGSGAISVAPPVLRTAVLIETEISGQDVPAKGARAIGGRLEALDMTLSDVIRARHAVAPLADALRQADADLVLVLTASATSDIRDVAPEALRRAGGEVTRFGMPVDPGNLLLLGELGGRPVIGLPGCARSPALNGADWVLQRIACGVPVTDASISEMGVGGLLKESPARGRPREA